MKTIIHKLVTFVDPRTQDNPNALKCTWQVAGVDNGYMCRMCRNCEIKQLLEQIKNLSSLDQLTISEFKIIREETNSADAMTISEWKSTLAQMCSDYNLTTEELFQVIRYKD